MNPYISKVLDIIFPRKCKVCGCYVTDNNKSFVCNDCWCEISVITPPICNICGIPFFSKDSIPEQYVCGRCRVSPPYFDIAVSFAVYDGVLKELIHHYKYNKKIGIADDLFSLAADLPERLSHIWPNAVIHTPLHKYSLRRRGFDQSFILAQRISDRFNLPFIFDNLIRIKKTASQVGLNKKAREDNIKGAFIIRRPEDLKGKNIILIDDVMTTGATVNECSRVLKKKAGVKYISVLTFGRTILLILCLILYAPLESAAVNNRHDNKVAPINITADEIEDIRKEDRVIGRGNVEMKYKDYYIKADTIRLNLNTGDGAAEDNVFISDRRSGSSIACEKANFNIKSKKGIIYDGQGDFRGEYFFSGKKIERIAEDKYKVYDGSLTTCIKNGQPSWMFKSKLAYIHLEHYAYLYHPTFRIKGVPVLYLPYIIVPVKTKRATGLLFPYIGTSDKDGYFVNNAFFWAINEQSDATLYIDYMTKKGVRPGIEYRYTPGKHTTGQINASYLKEKDTRKEFWKINLDHRQKFFYNTNNITYLDITGGNNPDKAYADSTGLRTRRHTDSYTSFTRNWDNSSLQVQGRYRKSIEQGVDEKFYQLPEASFTSQQIKIGNTPLFFNMESSYTFFINDKNNNYIEVHRTDIHPTIVFPFTRLTYLTFIPSAGIRETFYSRGKDENGSIIGGFSRELYDLNVEIEGPKFARIFLDKDSSPKYKHLIEPRVSYTYIPDVDKRDRAHIWLGFDAIDTITHKNIVAYSIFSQVLKKTGNRVSEVLRLEIKNSYDIREGVRRPFSDIRVDLDSSILDPFILNMDGEYNVYEKNIDTANIEVRLGRKGDTEGIGDISVERRFTRNISTFWTGSIGIRASRELSLRYSARYDELSRLHAESDYSIKYTAQCWAISLDFIDRKVILDGQRRSEFKFFILVTLKGIGSFGKKK